MLQSSNIYTYTYIYGYTISIIYLYILLYYLKHKFILISLIPVGPTGFYHATTQNYLHNLQSPMQNEMWDCLFKMCPEFQDRNKGHKTKQGDLPKHGALCDYLGLTQVKRALPSSSLLLSFSIVRMLTGNINSKFYSGLYIIHSQQYLM